MKLKSVIKKNIKHLQNPIFYINSYTPGFMAITIAVLKKDNLNLSARPLHYFDHKEKYRSNAYKINYSIQIVCCSDIKYLNKSIREYYTLHDFMLGVSKYIAVNSLLQ